MFHIRLANPSERAAVEAVVESAYAPYVPRLGRKPGPMLEDYGALIAGRDVHVLLDESRIVGILVLIPEKHEMLLDNVAVLPASQGRGYGRALIAFAEEAARARGLHAIRLYTNEAMTENIAFYRRLGFVETHRTEDKGFRRVYMAKPLDVLRS